MATATATFGNLTTSSSAYGTPSELLLDAAATVDPPGSIGDWGQPVTVECWGAGGTGEDQVGGGGGEYARTTLTLSALTAYAVVCDGEGDYLKSYLEGDSTYWAEAYSGSGAIPGSGGTGDVKYSGGTGGTGATGGGGGGGSGGSASAGNNGTNGGVGGGAGATAVTGGGAGGAGGNAAQNGNNGTWPGGAGGGRGAGGSAPGNGAAGKVKLTFTVAASGSLIGAKAKAAGGFQELAGGMQ